jgi:hypothetical protein
MIPPSLTTVTPLSSPFTRVVQVTRLTAAMEASASPRKPGFHVVQISAETILVWRGVQKPSGSAAGGSRCVVRNPDIADSPSRISMVSRGTCVHAVFHHFLDGGSRALHHLAAAICL